MTEVVKEEPGSKAGVPFSSSDPNNKPPVKEEVKPEVKVETKPEVKTEVKPEVKDPKAGPKKVQLGMDDEIPDDAELLELSKRALDSRLARHTKAALRERFGTDDTDAIKKKLDRLSELETQEEERKRAAMSEKDKLEADLRAAHAERDEANRQVRIVRNEQAIGQQDGQISKIAFKFIEADEDTWEVVSRRYARYLQEEHGDELNKKDFKISAADHAAWFENYAKEHPKHAKSAKTPKVPLNNGAPGAKDAPTPDAKSGTSQAKNFAPSGPNAMDRVTAKQEAGKQGYTW